MPNRIYSLYMISIATIISTVGDILRNASDVLSPVNAVQPVIARSIKAAVGYVKDNHHRRILLTVQVNL